MEQIELNDSSVSHRVLHDLGFFGHYLHMYAGGRSGKRHVLAKLHRHGGHLLQRELQEHSCISSAALSEVLSKLEGEGLVSRERSDEDRRQMQITLTDRGWKMAEEGMRAFQAFEAECLSCLSDEEQVALLETLDRLVEHWNGMGERGKCA